MLAKQEADQRTEEAMMSGKPVQQDESTELNRVCSLFVANLLPSQHKQCYICYSLVYWFCEQPGECLLTFPYTNSGATGSSATNILFRGHSSLSQ